MTYLDAILASHRELVAGDPRSLEDLIDDAKRQTPTRGFAGALGDVSGLGVIAEIKRRSPSKGALNLDLDPAEMARAYVAGDATCLSVLTDRDAFGGSPEDLRLARGAVGVPVLRKDFTVSPADICDARIMGADAVLLIVAALDPIELGDFVDLAGELGLDALVEAHDEHEVDLALAAGATMIGVNQRDLVTFEVDTDRAVRVVEAIPSTVVRIAESGIDGPASAARLAEAGYDAILVGESVVTAGTPRDAVRALRQLGR